MVDRSGIAEFLRGRRARLAPADVGLPGYGPRRTPGLRRQEVAELAGVSIDHYVRLEQARGANPSRQVLGALARALLLTADERDHLLRLGGHHPAGGGRLPCSPPTAVERILEALAGVPAYIVDARGDIVGGNRLSRHFTGDLSAPGAERNLLRWTFGRSDTAPAWEDPGVRGFAEAMVADLRAAQGLHPGEPGIAALVAELSASSARFAELWSSHVVRERRPLTKRIDHPSAGPMEFDCQILAVPGTGQRVIAYVAEPGSPTAQAFARLAELEPPAALHACGAGARAAGVSAAEAAGAAASGENGAARSNGQEVPG
ncbi:helix-turn-helix transcriptional regulator [Nocardiopsis coralliicola]